jgi:2-hydroxychromene-2-carboxylate isomerase
MPTSLEFWFEFASTYSYPATMRIEALCAAAGVPLRWRPFLLGPIFAAQGWSDSPFIALRSREFRRCEKSAERPFETAAPNRGLLRANGRGSIASTQYRSG